MNANTVTASDLKMVDFLITEVFRFGGYAEGGLYTAIAEYLDCDEIEVRDVLIAWKRDAMVTAILREQAHANA